ncbi:MAG: SDR family oxidoreductase [Candidatus Thermoplasmatota archaeon]
MDLGIEGNTALVTASSSGLGYASAEALAEEGVNVVINGRGQEKLDKAVEELQKTAAGEVVGISADLSKEEDIVQLVNGTIEEFGTIDHLVTCVGGPPSKKFMETREEEWYAAFDTLLMSVVLLVQETQQYLKEGKGTIVNITSISVKESIDDLVLSNSVRMGVIGLMKTLSRELAPEIRVNAVLPGYTETERVKELLNQSIERGDIDDYQEGLDDLSENTPLERIGQPEELGDVVAFLSSERSSYMTGVAVPVDGGWSRSNL